MSALGADCVLKPPCSLFGETRTEAEDVDPIECKIEESYSPLNSPVNSPIENPYAGSALFPLNSSGYMRNGGGDRWTADNMRVLSPIRANPSAASLSYNYSSSGSRRDGSMIQEDSWTPSLHSLPRWPSDSETSLYRPRSNQYQNTTRDNDMSFGARYPSSVNRSRDAGSNRAPWLLSQDSDRDGRVPHSRSSYSSSSSMHFNNNVDGYHYSASAWPSSGSSSMDLTPSPSQSSFSSQPSLQTYENSYTPGTGKMSSANFTSTNEYADS